MAVSRSLVFVALASVVFLGVAVGTPRVACTDELTENCNACFRSGGDCIVYHDQPKPYFAGCCLDGTPCPGPDGTSQCCGKNSNCDTTTGHCVAQCPTGTTKCQATVSAKMGYIDNFCVRCQPPNFIEPFSCACIPHCSPGQAQCGSGCCPAGQECAIPLDPNHPTYPPSSHMKCCPVLTPKRGGFAQKKPHGACGAYCMTELKSNSRVCCAGGGILSGGASADNKSTICCGGIACEKAHNWCIKGKCVPKLPHK